MALMRLILSLFLLSLGSEAEMPKGMNPMSLRDERKSSRKDAISRKAVKETKF